MLESNEFKVLKEQLLEAYTGRLEQGETNKAAPSKTKKFKDWLDLASLECDTEQWAELLKALAKLAVTIQHERGEWLIKNTQPWFKVVEVAVEETPLPPQPPLMSKSDQAQREGESKAAELEPDHHQYHQYSQQQEERRPLADDDTVEGVGDVGSTNYYRKLDQPIRELATRVRIRAYETVGQAGFAKLLLEFDQKHSGSLEWVLTTMRTATKTQARTFKLGICWLDGRGYGAKTLIQMLLMKQ